MIDQVQILFLPPILLTVMQCCEQEYHQQQLLRYQPFLERRGDWTYCALAIRSDHSEVKISNLSGYNSRHLRIETYHVKSNTSVAVMIFIFFARHLSNDDAGNYSVNVRNKYGEKVMLSFY